jgi:N6-L-threonylcarbamoyladenine synthase
MLVLGIETSCDETSASVVSGGRKILSNVISSQIDIHREFSGVVPELASRAHLGNINRVTEEALSAAGFSFDDLGGKIKVIAYTRGPGLAGSLLVGQIAAQTLSFIHGTKLVGVNHLEGHLYSALLDHPALKPPFLSLVVSGGHTELMIIKDFGRYEVLGGTRDDAAGEAFDKVAKLLKLDYPGGPEIDRFSKKGDPEAVLFPRPYMRDSWDFSFSGLKTAVLNHVKTHGYPAKRSKRLFDICASFQASVVDTLAEKTFSAAKRFKLNKIVLGGGVTANSALRKSFMSRGKKEKYSVYLPSPVLCTDNAAMIACAGYYKFANTCADKYRFDAIQKIEPGLELKNW